MSETAERADEISVDKSAGSVDTGPSDAPERTPAGYASWSAEAKRNWLFETLLCGSEFSPVRRPDLTMTPPWTMASIAARPAVLARTLDRADDMMEADRPKIIHTRGAVAMVQFVTNADSPYTGVLAPSPAGGASGLVRLSLAVPPQGKGSITPGIGLKLLVDANPSIDLLAMNHTVGQGRDFNLFSNTFTHNLSSEHDKLRTPQKVMSWFFKKVVSEPRELTIDHFGDRQADGTIVAEPRVPDRLVFRPHADVRRSVYDGAQGEDFRDPLLRIEPGTRLWTVEAIEGADVTEIATLTTTSRFCCSEGGDRLFFRHHVAPEHRRS